MPISCQYVQFFSNEIKAKNEVVSMQAMKYMGTGNVDTIMKSAVYGGAG